MILSLYTDGGARGNPGPAAWGFVIYQDNKKVADGSGYLGSTTNNVAEYTACVEGLEYILQNFGHNQQVQCFADSKLMIEQVCGRYKVKAPHLKPFIEKIRELAHQITEVSYKHIPREKNTEADRLVNLMLDKQRNMKN